MELTYPYALYPNSPYCPYNDIAKYNNNINKLCSKLKTFYKQCFDSIHKETSESDSGLQEEPVKRTLPLYQISMEPQ